MERLRVVCLFVIFFGVCSAIYGCIDVYGDACGGRFNSSTGLITSPNYPLGYPLCTVCEWIIEDPNKNQILLNFANFTLENCGSCSCDYLEIRKGGSAGSTLLGQYCGSTVPANITSSGYEIYLKLTTDQSSGYAGFYLRWGSAMTGTDTVGGKSPVRGGHFNSSSGVITSPNYPTTYPHNFETEWIIEARKGWAVVLNVKKFKLETDWQCLYDYLEIRNGSSEETSTLIGKYCGTTIPAKITCPGDNRVFLRFRSDGSKYYEGFLIEWTRTIISGSRENSTMF